MWCTDDTTANRYHAAAEQLAEQRENTMTGFFAPGDQFIESRNHLEAAILLATDPESQRRVNPETIRAHLRAAMPFIQFTIGEVGEASFSRDYNMAVRLCAQYDVDLPISDVQPA